MTEDNGFSVLETMALDEFGCVRGTLETASGQMRMRPTGISQEAKPNLSILIVDDDAATKKGWTTVLKGDGYERVYAVGSANEVLDYLQKTTPDLILMDLNLGESKNDGFKLMEKISVDLRILTDYVVVTGDSNKKTMQEAMGYGAIDFINKPVSIEELRIRVEKAFVNKFIRAGYTQDPLTGLGNKRTFLNRLDSSIIKYSRNRNPLSLVMMDVDNFKQWNDRFGHLEGDYALRKLGNYLQNNLREDDISAKYGGDEFGIIMPDTTFLQAKEVFGRVVAWDFGQVEFRPKEGAVEKITFSAGISTLHQGAEKELFPEINFSRLTEDDVLLVRKAMISGADYGLYKVKLAGRNNYFPKNGLLYHNKSIN